jgi:hypothetical protein
LPLATQGRPDRPDLFARVYMEDHPIKPISKPLNRYGQSGHLGQLNSPKGLRCPDLALMVRRVRTGGMFHANPRAGRAAVCRPSHRQPPPPPRRGSSWPFGTTGYQARNPRACFGFRVWFRWNTGVPHEFRTRSFQDAREAAGVAGDNPPSFHDIRSLGGALVRDAGWTTEEVQALMGHASKSMTEHYLDGHDAPWTELSTGANAVRTLRP